MTTDTLTRAAPTRPNTWNADTRTVSAVIATPSPVRRRDARGPFLEILTADTLNLPASEGLPVLDSHRTATVRDTLGRVRSIALEGGSVTAVLEMTAAEDAAPVVQRIADGTVSGVSIGYRVAGWTEKQTTAGRVKTPTAWTITEVTLTSNPADPSARLRHKEESPMPDEILETETVSPEAAEQTRRTDIRALVRSANLDAQAADDLIDAGADITRAKAEIFDAVQDRRRAAPIIRSHAPANDDPATITRRQSDALAFRMGAGGDPADDVRPFLNLSLRDMAIDALTRSGISTRGMSADEVFTRAGEHTTSDFPLTVSNAMGKVALDTYRAAESPLKALCRQRTLPNFKDSTSIRLGDMTAALGEAAAQTEADILVDLLTGNPNMADGTAVFDASRDNIGTASAPDVDALTEARLAMRTRKGLDGKTIIAAAPRYVLVGADLETEAERVLASIQPSTTGDVNPFGGKLTLLVEPRLPAGTWYVFADPARLAAMQYAYLSSAQGVQIQRTEAWDTLGMKYRAFLDFGAGWLDWRGAHQIPGA